MAKHLFIDTNVYLRVFRKTSDTLNEVELLLELVEAGEVVLYTTDQVIEEYFRNVEREIEEAFQEIRAIPDRAELPRLAQDFDHASEILEAFNKIQTAKKALLAEAAEAAQGGVLKADALITGIFDAAVEIDRTDEIIDASRLRRDLGNPPGKKDSLGDQINWECLLAEVPDATEFAIISRDGDFTVKIGARKVKQFLKDEWSAEKDSEIALFHDIKGYLSHEFPDFKDAKSVKKSSAIKKLENSRSFMTTHRQIANLEEVYDQIKSSDSIRIFEALLSNNQIKWIATDEDVESFYTKLFKRYYHETPSELDERLYGVAPYLDPNASTDEDEDDEDDMPF